MKTPRKAVEVFSRGRPSKAKRNLDGSVTQWVHDRRYYNGNYEEDHVAPKWWGQPGIVRKIHYIAGGDGICAMYIQTQIGEGEIKDSIFYVYKDYLGSFLTFTDEKGDVKYEQNFDAWGRYRNIKDWSYVNTYNSKPSELPRWLYRGFTGHEHLNREQLEFNLINMNGRLYDPINGRMLSVDNYAHDDAGTQGYNRYTYANNNPLKYTDPDGEVPFFIIPNVGWSSSGGLSIGLEFGIGIPGLLSASVTVGYSFGSKQLSASIQGGAVGFYAGYGTGGAFAGFGFNHGGVSIGAGVSYSGDGNWDFNGGVSLGGSSGNYNGSIGIGWSLSSGFGANVGAGYTHRFEIDRYRKKAPEFVPKNSVGGVQSVGEQECGPCIIIALWLAAEVSKSPTRNHANDAAGIQSAENNKNAMLALALIPGGVFEEGIAAKTSTKLLNQFNSAESLIYGAGNLSKVKAGMQEFVKGDGASIFKAITNGGTLSPKGYYTMPNGTVISKYFSSTSGDFTIFINQGSNAFKIRITP